MTEPEKRSTVAHRAVEEYYRYATQMGIEPDVLVLSKTEAKTLLQECGHPVPWACTPGSGEVGYGQFNGMDIVATDRMPDGFIIVGRRVPTEVVIIQRKRVPP